MLVVLQVVSEFSPQFAEDEEEAEYNEMLQHMYGGARDEEDEDEYFHALATRALGSKPRYVGNRMFGSGGVLATGRRAARATPNAGPSGASASQDGVRTQYSSPHTQCLLTPAPLPPPMEGEEGNVTEADRMGVRSRY